ncbi:MAG: outer membrane protein, partial [Acidobacteriota bacterium]
FSGPFGLELGLEYSPVASFNVGPIGVGASIMNVMGNFVVQIPVGRFAPYGTVGYGVMIGRANIDPLPIEFLGRVGAFNFGFGAKIFVSEHIGLRLDYRRFAVQTDSDSPELQVPLTSFRIDTSPDLDRFVAGVAFRF